MNTWLTPVSKILGVRVPTLRSLAIAAGSDPRIFYIHQDLSTCDLRGEDLRGMDLTGTGISSSQMDELTLVDNEFDPRIEYFGKRYFEINHELEGLVRQHSRYMGYRYDAWTIKHLIHRTYELSKWDTGEFNTLLHAIINSKPLSKLISRRIGKRFDHRITISEKEHAFVVELGTEFAHRSVAYAAAIVIGLLVDYRVPSLSVDGEFDIAAHMENQNRRQTLAREV